MQKIPTIFEKLDEKAPIVANLRADGLFWYWDGEGVATRKWDGLPVLVRDGKLYKHMTLSTKIESMTPGFIPCDKPDARGYVGGWTPVTDNPGDIWFHDAPIPKLDGTYELVGPKIRHNAERMDKHTFIMHGIHTLKNVPRDYAGLRDYLRVVDIEGIVWHRGNGEMCKIRKVDLGLKR